MKKLSVLSLVFLIFIGCGRSSNSDFGIEKEEGSEYSSGNGLVAKFNENDEPVSVSQKQQPPSPNSREAQQASAKKLIKQGSMVIEVTDLEPSKKKVDEIVANLGAYYDNEVYQEQFNSLVYDLKIRVPVDRFESLVKSLEGGFDKILDKNISTVDVTARYVDLEGRLTSKRAALERYRTILKSAKTIKEILEVEEYIRKIEEEIESTTVQLKQLGNQTSYSTLSVSLQHPLEINENRKEPGFWIEAKRAIISGWKGLEVFVLVLLRVWPFLILISALVFAIRWFRGR